MAAETMKSLVYDKSAMPWDKSRGFVFKDMPIPILNESADPTDGQNVHVPDIANRAVAGQGKTGR